LEKLDIALPYFLEADYPKIGSAFAFRIVITRFLDLRLEVAVSGRLLPQRVDLGLRSLDYLEKRAVLILRSFIANHWIAAGGVTPLTKKEARQRTTARRIILPLLHSCPGGICKSSIHSL